MGPLAEELLEGRFSVKRHVRSGGVVIGDEALDRFGSRFEIAVRLTAQAFIDDRADPSLALAVGLRSSWSSHLVAYALQLTDITPQM